MTDDTDNKKPEATPQQGGPTEAALLYGHLDKIARYPIGHIFSTKEGGGPVRYGWVVGYGINPAGELVFKVRWAHIDSEQLLHPSHVHHVLKFADV